MAGKIITIAQQKGGSGKTTLAANLAVGFAEGGANVAVLDIDPQGSLGRWFLTRIERKGEEPGLEFSTASAWGASYECGKLRKAHDIVIVDTPPKIDSDLRPALRVSDLVIVPISVSHVDLWATEGVLELAARERAPVLIVMNRVASRARLTAEVGAEVAKLDAPCADTVLGNRVAYAASMGEGLAVLESHRKAAAGQEVAALMEELRGVLARL